MKTTSSKTKRVLKFLDLLRKSNTKQRQKLLEVAGQTIIALLSEICLNASANNLLFKPNDVQRLKPFKNVIRRIGSSANSDWNRNALVYKNQKGGAIASVIPILLTAASTLIPELIDRIRKA